MIKVSFSNIHCWLKLVIVTVLEVEGKNSVIFTLRCFHLITDFYNTKIKKIDKDEKKEKNGNCRHIALQKIAKAYANGQILVLNFKVNEFI